VTFVPSSVTPAIHPLCVSPIEPVVVLSYPTVLPPTRSEPSPYRPPTKKPAAMTDGNTSTLRALPASSHESLAVV